MTVLDPVGRVETVTLALPPVVVPVPSTVAPKVNFTFSPSGIAPPVEDTVAVNIPACPEADGFCDDTTIVVVVYLLTTCLTVPELAANFASPLYVAVMVKVPAGRDDVVRLAWPPLVVPVPSGVPLLLNVTVSPSGIEPPAEETVAVNVTDCPIVDGVSELVTVVVDAYFCTTSNTLAEVLAMKLLSPG